MELIANKGTDKIVQLKANESHYQTGSQEKASSFKGLFSTYGGSGCLWGHIIIM